ncbi:MAG: 2-oxoacid:acceptor oxidoreductase subunit alpha [Candidatus Marinimicrobia bacterium]|nr:2-oxoacid:acceptor oxidoreductase subunit alpha [Candidatus Neomarinimicrobiota bacterium]
MSETTKSPKKQTEQVSQVTIRFAGDSGDGMQLTGNQFSDTSAIFGNDLATLPDYPSEIRAPAGSLAGVSSYQIQFASVEIHTPGDEPDVLVAMNPAALKVHLPDLRAQGTIIANTANFNKRNLQLAGWDENPLEGDMLKDYRVIAVDMHALVVDALKDIGLPAKIMARSTNMFALGLLYWMYDRPMDSTFAFLEDKFQKRPEIIEANKKAVRAGYHFGETTELTSVSYVVTKAKKPAGTYRNIMGNHALALGLVAAGKGSDLPFIYAGYPITPASDILHILAGYKNFRIITFQAEDEIAAVTAAIGAAYAGALAVTGTSGPGMALKSEALGLAVSAELPLVVVNVQRGGPSTGMPTKTEQADLSQAMIGRNGETPMVVLAASTPADCFDTAYEACQIAIEHMVPVIVLSDSYLGNGSEPWRIPDVNGLPKIKNRLVKEAGDKFQPFAIVDEKYMARSWAIPGIPGLEHRIGGLEKDSLTGNVSGDFLNHEHMVDRRQKKIDVVADRIPLAKAYGDESGDLLVLGWGSTYGAIRSGVDRARAKGVSVSHVHLKHLNPFPRNLGEVLVKFSRILIPEMNKGQLARFIRAEYLIDVLCYSKIDGRPFVPSQIENKIAEILGDA